MSNYNIDNSPVTSGVLTTSYSYGTADKEYVFSCKGRPFAALVSPNLPTPTATLLDYDLVRKLRLKMTDVQCRKFQLGGHKMRILGRVSSAVQCVQGGRISGSFHIKGLVVTDLYDLLDTHCVAGTKMRERIRVTQYHSHSTHLAGGSTDDEDDDDMDTMTSTSAPSATMSSSSASSGMMTSSSAPSGMMTCSSTPLATMSSSSASSGMMTCSSAPSATMSSSTVPSGTMTISSSPSGTMTSSSAPSGTMICSSAPSETMMTSSSSVKMSPYVTFPKVLACNRVAVTETKTKHADRFTVPDRSDLFWEVQAPSEDLQDAQEAQYLYWFNRCHNKDEGETLKKSHTDGLPRVINLDGQNDDMLRVGNWAGLVDPARHQARHVHLAQIRRYEYDIDSKDRVCDYCSYDLGHKCDLYYPAVVHCKECCIRIQLVNRERERVDRERNRDREEGQMATQTCKTTAASTEV